MPQIPKDTTLASNFTNTQHTKASPTIDPQSSTLPTPLNVLIIGASQGIGASIAHAYASAGTTTLLLSARASSLSKLQAVEQTAHKLSPSIRTACFSVDITSSSSVAELATTIKETYGKLDILVLNSGYSGPVVVKVDDGDPQDFQDVIDVNLVGTYHVAHHFVPLLKESRGAKTFIAVGSFAALITSGPIANTAYCISKFAQARFVEFLAEQFGEEGVLAVAVHPGAVNTEMADRTTPESFRPYLTDDVELCGAFCVWLSCEKRMWLNGRLLSAKWDVDELLEKKDSIEGKDLLKFRLRIDTSGGHDRDGL